jgi:hypothetical protein
MTTKKGGYSFLREEAQERNGYRLWRGPFPNYGVRLPLYEPMVDRLYESEEFEDPFTTAFEDQNDEPTKEEIQRVKEIRNGTL